MARPVEFDRTKALEAAMKVFWSHGYTATSLPDLLEAMDIGRSSFYASFHTKRDLFMECLELFGDRTLSIVQESSCGLTATLPRAFFEATLLDVSKRKASQGCMMVNTVLELASVDPELNKLASEKLDAIENAFFLVFRKAQEEDQLDENIDARSLASLVMTINHGLRVHSRQGKSRAQLKAIIDSSISLLGLSNPISINT